MAHTDSTTLPDPTFTLTLKYHLSLVGHGEWCWEDADKGLSVFKTSEPGKPPLTFVIHETRETITDYKSMIYAYKATNKYLDAINTIL